MKENDKEKSKELISKIHHSSKSGEETFQSINFQFKNLIIGSFWTKTNLLIETTTLNFATE